MIQVSMRSCSGATRATSSTSAAGISYRAVVVHDNNIVGIDAHAATADRLLPIDKGKAGHRGGSRRARTPNGEADLDVALIGEAVKQVEAQTCYNDRLSDGKPNPCTV